MASPKTMNINSVGEDKIHSLKRNSKDLVEFINKYSDEKIPYGCKNSMSEDVTKRDPPRDKIILKSLETFDKNDSSSDDDSIALSYDVFDDDASSDNIKLDAADVIDSCSLLDSDLIINNYAALDCDDVEDYFWQFSEGESSGSDVEYPLTTSFCRVLPREDALPYAKKFGSFDNILGACALSQTPNVEPSLSDQQVPAANPHQDSHEPELATSNGQAAGEGTNNRQSCQSHDKGRGVITKDKKKEAPIAVPLENVQSRDKNSSDTPKSSASQLKRKEDEQTDSSAFSKKVTRSQTLPARNAKEIRERRNRAEDAPLDRKGVSVSSFVRYLDKRKKGIKKKFSPSRTSEASSSTSPKTKQDSTKLQSAVKINAVEAASDDSERKKSNEENDKKSAEKPTSNNTKAVEAEHKEAHSSGRLKSHENANHCKLEGKSPISNQSGKPIAPSIREETFLFKGRHSKKQAVSLSDIETLTLSSSTQVEEDDTAAFRSTKLKESCSVSMKPEPITFGTQPDMLYQESENRRTQVDHQVHSANSSETFKKELSPGSEVTIEEAKCITNKASTITPDAEEKSISPSPNACSSLNKELQKTRENEICKTSKVLTSEDQAKESPESKDSPKLSDKIQPMRRVKQTPIDVNVVYKTNSNATGQSAQKKNTSSDLKHLIDAHDDELLAKLLTSNEKPFQRRKRHPSVQTQSDRIKVASSPKSEKVSESDPVNSLERQGTERRGRPKSQAKIENKVNPSEDPYFAGQLKPIVANEQPGFCDPCLSPFQPPFSRPPSHPPLPDPSAYNMPSGPFQPPQMNPPPYMGPPIQNVPTMRHNSFRPYMGYPPQRPRQGPFQPHFFPQNVHYPQPSYRHPQFNPHHPNFQPHVRPNAYSPLPPYSNFEPISRPQAPLDRPDYEDPYSSRRVSMRDWLEEIDDSVSKLRMEDEYGSKEHYRDYYDDDDYHEYNNERYSEYQSPRQRRNRELHKPPPPAFPSHLQQRGWNDPPPYQPRQENFHPPPRQRELPDPDRESYAEFMAEFARDLRNPKLCVREQNFRCDVMSEVQRLRPLVKWQQVMRFYDVTMQRYYDIDSMHITAEEKDAESRLLLQSMTKEVLGSSDPRNGGEFLVQCEPDLARSIYNGDSPYEQAASRTLLCKVWNERGVCPNGANCPYVHSCIKCANTHGANYTHPMLECPY